MGRLCNTRQNEVYELERFAQELEEGDVCDVEDERSASGGEDEGYEEAMKEMKEELDRLKEHFVSETFLCFCLFFFNDD